MPGIARCERSRSHRHPVGREAQWRGHAQSAFNRHPTDDNALQTVKMFSNRHVGTGAIGRLIVVSSVSIAVGIENAPKINGCTVAMYAVELIELSLARAAASKWM